MEDLSLWNDKVPQFTPMADFAFWDDPIRSMITEMKEATLNLGSNIFCLKMEVLFKFYCTLTQILISAICSRH